MSDAAMRLDDQALAKFLEDHPQDLVMVDFFADWCPYCQMVGPILEELARKYHDKGVHILKVDTDNSAAASQIYGVEVLPTIVLLQGGKELERCTGAKDKPYFENLISKHLKT